MRKTIANIARGLPERVGWEKGLGPFLYKKLPPKTGWALTLGSASVLMFVTMFVTGVFLAMYYNPSPDKAYQAIDYIMNDVPAGRILRGLHHWGASAMVIIVFLHMATNFFSGTYKRPRELTWISGVIMFLIVLGLGFTGYLLPWDLKAYWATTVSTNIPKDIPFVGKFLSHLALGGENISGATLTRFYAIHAMLLPALLVGLIAFHIYLVRAHGIAEESDVAEEDKTVAGAPRPRISASAADAETRGRGAHATIEVPRERLYRFFPEHLWRSSIVFVAVFLILLGLSLWAHVPREPVAGTLVDSYLPRPEWYYMWLFQLLTLFPGKLEWVGSLVIPMLGVALLFLLPFLGKPNARIGIRNRPIPLAIGSTVIVAIAYLTCMGFAGAKPYGETIRVPDRQLTPTEQRGLYLYADRQCAYCHQIQGSGGHRVGPDLSNEVAKHHDVDYLMRYIHDPQSVNRTSIMPKYDLPESDLRSLAEFIRSLDFNNKRAKTVTREQAMTEGK